MKRLILFAALASASQANAQPVLTASDAPAAGHTAIMVNADTTGITPGGAGANTTWNFSNLQALDTTTTVYVTPAGTPSAGSFPSANLASYDTDDSSYHSYYSKTAADMQLLGYGDGTDVFTAADPMKALIFPFNTTSSFADSFSFNGSFLTFPITQSGHMSVMADGYGTLITPLGTYHDVIRLRRFVVSNITSIIVTSIDTVEAYEWHKAGYQSPLMVITKNITVDPINNTVDTYKAVQYSAAMPPVTNVLHVNTASSFRIAPNPATDFVLLPDLKEEAVFVITDMSGKKVLSGTVTPSGPININMLSSGSYLFHVESSAGVRPQMLQVIR